jgi:protein-tyrosine phosphatase
MVSQVYWIDLPTSGRLAIMARPRAGDWLDDEIAAWRLEGIDCVVSLLEPWEVTELGLQRDPALCREHGMEFASLPIPDRGVPQSSRDTVRLAQAVTTIIGGGKSDAVHCRAGVGRSSLVAACILAYADIDANAALEMISKARGCPVPDTEEQRRWVEDFHAAMTAGLGVELSLRVRPRCHPAPRAAPSASRRSRCR